MLFKLNDYFTNGDIVVPDWVKEYLPFVESLCVILGVIFIVVQIRQQTKNSRADHDRQKKQSTIEFYNTLSTESYLFLDSVEDLTLDLAYVNSDKELRRSVIRYLSRLERLAIGVSTDVYDFHILYFMSGRFLSYKYEQFRTYIEETRVSKNAPTFYKEFELLVERIENYRERHPNKTVSKSFYVKRP